CQVGANAVDEDPRHMVQVVLDQQVCDLFQPLDADVGAVVEDTDLLRTQVFDQVTPLCQHILRAAAAPFDGHNALAAEGAAIGAAAAGHDAEAARTVHMVSGGLQVGVALHLKEMVGRPRQAVQVGDRRAVQVVVDLAVAGLIGNAQAVLENLILRMHEGIGVIFRHTGEIGFQAFANVDPSLFAFPTHDNVDIGLLAAFFVQHAHLVAAEHNGAVMHRFDHLRGPAGLLYLGRVGGNPDDVRAEPLDELGHRLIFDVGIKDNDFIASSLTHSRQICQPQMGGSAGVDGKTEARIDQCYTHGLCLLDHRSRESRSRESDSSYQLTQR